MPRAVLFGRKITRSAVERTSPAASRGASGKSTTAAFAAMPGRSAKVTRATIFSYGPAAPNALPAATSTRRTTSTLTTRASAAGGRPANSSVAAASAAAVPRTFTLRPALER
ncbi:MAG: hypothetical protein ABR591_10445 [Candidatus Velthaea sp.]